MEDVFKTNDIQIAAFLFAKGLKYKGIEKLGMKCFFLFENNKLCRNYELGFINGDEASATKLFSARDMLMGEIKKAQYEN